jgi:hypothetical protein
MCIFFESKEKRLSRKQQELTDKLNFEEKIRLITEENQREYDRKHNYKEGDYLIGRIVIECSPVTEYKDIYGDGVDDGYKGTIVHGSYMEPSKWTHIRGIITAVDNKKNFKLGGEWYSANEIIIDELLEKN